MADDVATLAGNKAIIERFWDDLGRSDFEAVAGYFTEASHYTDVPAPEARLRSWPASVSGSSRSSGTSRSRGTVADGDAR